MDIPSWARVGASVICVNVECTSGATWFGEAPTLHAIYQISRVWFDPEGDIVMEFVELKRSRDVELGDIGYYIERFRPLVTRSQEQDVAAIKKLLTDMPEEIDA